MHYLIELLENKNPKSNRLTIDKLKSFPTNELPQLKEAFANNKIFETLEIDNTDEEQIKIIANAIKFNSTIINFSFNNCNPVELLNIVNDKFDLIQIKNISPEIIEKMMPILMRRKKVFTLGINDTSKESITKILEKLKQTPILMVSTFALSNLPGDSIDAVVNYLSTTNRHCNLILKDGIVEEDAREVVRKLHYSNIKITGQNKLKLLVVKELQKLSCKPPKESLNNKESQSSKLVRVNAMTSKNNEIEDQAETVKKRKSSEPKESASFNNKKKTDPDNEIKKLRKQCSALKQQLTESQFKSTIVISALTAENNSLREQISFANGQNYKLQNDHSHLIDALPSGEIEPLMQPTILHKQLSFTSAPVLRQIPPLPQAQPKFIPIPPFIAQNMKNHLEGTNYFSSMQSAVTVQPMLNPTQPFFNTSMPLVPVKQTFWSNNPQQSTVVPVLPTSPMQITPAINNQSAILARLPNQLSSIMVNNKAITQVQSQAFKIPAQNVQRFITSSPGAVPKQNVQNTTRPVTPTSSGPSWTNDPLLNTTDDELDQLNNIMGLKK